jgi:hypothetical protein
LGDGKVIRTKLVIFGVLVAGIASFLAYAQNKNQASQNWIDGLKATPVARFEAGMPEKPLGEWLVANARGSEVQYTVEPCAGEGTGPMCIRATLGQGAVVLKFVVAAADKSGGPQAVSYRFLVGWEGPPPGSSMKRPTRKISKLSDLRTMLHWN